MLLLSLLALPVVFGVAVFFLGKNRITLVELAIQLVVACGLMVAGYYRTRWNGLQDVEIWSGRVASKPSGSSTCCHTHSCRCHQACSGTGSKRRCRDECDTCYEHPSDLFHDAYSTNGERVYHSRCDRSPPARWTRIAIGEPTAVGHGYTNYIKADPRQFVPPAVGAVTAPLAPYPTVDGWHAQRLLFAGVAPPAGWAQLGAALDELNADLGPTKHVNAIVVVTADPSPAYFDALRAAWLGGKKNDVVLVIGAPAFPAIAWARVMAWNKATGGEDEFKGGLATRIEGLGPFDGARVLAILREEIEARYVQRSLSELAYLIARAQPSGTAVVVLFVVGLAVSALLHRLFWRNRRTRTGPPPHVVVAQLARRLRGRRAGPPDEPPTGGRIRSRRERGPPD